MLAHELSNSIITYFRNKFSQEVPNSNVIVCRITDYQAINEINRPRLVVSIESIDDNGGRGVYDNVHTILLTLYYPVKHVDYDISETGHSVAHCEDWVDNIISVMKYYFKANLITSTLADYSDKEIAYSLFFEKPRQELSEIRKFTDYGDTYDTSINPLIGDESRFDGVDINAKRIETTVEIENNDDELIVVP